MMNKIISSVKASKAGTRLHSSSEINLNILFPSRTPSVGVDVYGEPIHDTKESIIEKYKSVPLESFLSDEQRNSVGSYVLVDRTETGCRFISSIGYCGGYIRKTDQGTNVSTMLRDALHAEIETVQFDEAILSYMLSYVPSSTWGALPLSTAFRNIQRLNAGSVLELNMGGVTKYATYIKLETMDRPESLEDAVWETATKFANYYKRKGTTPTVMFSGGADSLLILLALQRVMGKDSVEAISIITSKSESLTNGHYRAIPVARNIGAEVEIANRDWENSEAVTDEILAQMRNDLINSRRPDLALVDHPEVSTTVLHGQNFDALSGTKMVTLDACQDRDILSAPMLTQNNDAQYNLQLKTLVQNVSFTEEALNDPAYSSSIAAFLRKITPSTIPDPDAGTLMGTIRGTIATQIPGLLHAPREPFSKFSQLKIMTAEAERMIAFLDQKVSPADALNLCTFYGYSQLAVKRGCSQKLSTGTDISFFAMSGPIASYFLGRKRNMADSLSPKREIYAFIEKLCGRPYTELRTRNDADNARIKALEDTRKKDDFDTLISRSKEHLSPEKSRILPRISDGKIREAIAELYGEIASNNQPDVLPCMYPFIG